MLSLSINVTWIPVIVIIGALLGFSFRSAQIKKSKKRILILENEMLRDHAEILKLQQELASIRNENLPAFKSRVVPMNETPPDENPESKEGSGKKKNAK